MVDPESHRQEIDRHRRSRWCCGLPILTNARGRKLYLFRFTLRPPAKRLWCPYVHPQPQPPFINHPYSFKSDISKKSGVLRPPAVQSVQGCYARLRTPSVAAPVQKLPLTLKIRHIKEILVVYVPQPCSRCRDVAQGYIHPQSPPPFKNHP